MTSPPQVMPALITPFGEDGEIDTNAHRHNVATLWDRGVRGFLVGGSTGEGPYLEPGERLALVDGARLAAPEAFILCGIAAETTRKASRQIDEASAATADGVLVMTPSTLVRGRDALIEGFYRDLAERATIPMYLYSVPPVTGYAIAAEAVERLAELERIEGMKDSGGDPVATAGYLASTPHDFTLWAGASRSLALSVAAGAHGAITASANYAPALVQEVVQTADRSQTEARALQRRLAVLAGCIERYGVPGVKAAAAAAGLQPGLPRLPLRPVAEDVVSEIARALRT